MGRPIIWNGANAKLINSGDLIDSNANSLTNGGKANYTWTSHGLTVGGTADIGRPVYLINATTLAFADQTLGANAEVVGFIYAVLDANTVRIIFAGEIPTVGSSFLEGGGSLVPGTVYFLAATAGKVTATEPTTIGYVSKPLGVAVSTTEFSAFNMRGSVVGSANARTQINLANNTASQTVQNVSLYDAGELAGWVLITNSTPANSKRFYVQAPFAKYGGSANYYISPSFVGDTPPAGFTMTVTAGGLIQVSMPNVSGYASAVINFALNAPAVGTNFPLSVDAASITSGTVAAARLPSFAPTQTKYTSGSGTYTAPAGVKWLKVRMVGGGGGGGGSGATGTAGLGGGGGVTTFGSSFLTCNGGGGGKATNADAGGSGGTASIGSGAVGIFYNGGIGNCPGLLANPYACGGSGASSPFSSGGASTINQSGVTPPSNSGAGGAGGSTGAASAYTGSGGGSGGYIDAIISSPLASYSYAVGAAGSAGSAGTSGYGGGNGAAGIIIIEEYYY